MKTLANKLGQLRINIQTQRGEFSLYALVLPEDAIAWDLLVAAKWIDEDKSAGLQYLVKQIQSVLTKKELLSLSGIIIGDSSHFIGSMSMNSEAGWEENDIDFYGRHVQKAYVFTAPAEDFHVSLS